MILYGQNNKPKRERSSRHLNISIDELPERPKYLFNSNRDRVKFIKMVESIVRTSPEYKAYIKFLKDDMDMSRCVILHNIYNGNGKTYTIEIHHEPFSLFAIVEIVLNKWEVLGKKFNPFLIAEEVMGLHYDGKIGLVPLTKTMHELVTVGKTFIPLHFIYQNYVDFYNEYEPYIDDSIKDLIEYKVDMSLKCAEIQSDVLDVEFVYLDVDGFKFPEVPEEWGELLKKNSAELLENS